jgi:hypothetical protein
VPPSLNIDTKKYIKKIKISKINSGQDLIEGQVFTSIVEEFYKLWEKENKVIPVTDGGRSHSS